MTCVELIFQKNTSFICNHIRNVRTFKVELNFETIFALKNEIVLILKSLQ